eukprot:TRINITY_DN617_c0_g2_i1.p1 TRINITY_DN617_c0_g2~~TRINITY_DN617_c0_g2_i1.p1  ORF type:complete len:259 (+),score=56.05 TRINITY_DN617_c0_g2_i1:54-830(+)
MARTMTTPSKAFIISAFVAAVGIVFMVSALVDGKSLFELRNDYKTIGNPNATEPVFIKDMPLIGYPYGIGVYNDIFGNQWTHGKRYSGFLNLTNHNLLGYNSRPAHFMHLYDCEIQHVGELICAAAIIVAFGSAFALGFSVVGANVGGRKYGLACVVIHGFTAIFYFIAVVATAFFYNQNLNCKEFKTLLNGWDDTIQINYIFSYGYAVAFFGVGLGISLCAIVCLLVSDALCEFPYIKSADPTETEELKTVETEEKE